MNTCPSQELGHYFLAFARQWQAIIRSFNMTIITRDRFLPDEEATVNQGFAEYNRGQGQESTRQPIALASYTADGKLAGALDGYVFFDWLTVSRLWVACDARGRGLGTELLLAAENIAKELSCAGGTLSTYDFQARPFYEKLGYEVFGVLPDNPRGRERFFMRKTF
jgi:GNAT superfamily N-acetyltransferase